MSENAVPIDLLLSQVQESLAVLVICGSNTSEGSKMVSQKMFRVASLVLTKLAIPISQSLPHSNRSMPQINLFNNGVLVKVIDQQSILKGKTTLMACLNSLSSMIESVTGERNLFPSHKPSFSLVLMDELGARTDPITSGAIAQAVLKKLLESKQCCVLATTHTPHLFSCTTVLVPLRNDPSSISTVCLTCCNMA